MPATATQLATPSGEPTPSDRRPRVVLTIGKFDGVHAGHRLLLTQTIVEAGRRGVQSAALVLHPDPRAVLTGDRVPLLTSLRDRCSRMRSFGVDYAEPLRFTRDIAGLGPAEFLDRVQERFDLAALVVGPDFAFGHQRSGGIDTLQQLGRDRGFDVSIVEPLEIDGLQIGSRHVRRMVQDGDIDLARRLLRAPPRLTGTVIHGSARGRTLGFPTANLDPIDDYVVPANGIYTVRVRWHRGRNRGATGQADGVASIGIRPTFDSGPRVVEIFLLDFGGDLYGCRMTVDFLARQRPELRFDSSQALIAQMHDDVVVARAVVAAETAPLWELIESGPVAALQVRGHDLAALCEHASAAVYELVGLEPPPGERRGTAVNLEAETGEELFTRWLISSNMPLDAEHAHFHSSSVFQADGGVLRALLLGGPDPISRSPLDTVRLCGSIARDGTGWLNARVECALRP